MKKLFILIPILAVAFVITGCTKVTTTDTNAKTSIYTKNTEKTLIQNSNQNTNELSNNLNVSIGSSNQNTNTISNINSAAAQTKNVSVTNSGFQPTSVSIPAGGAIVWTNNDSFTHYVAPDNHPTHQKYAGIWDDNGAGNISTGQTYSMTFNIPGSYTYHDHLNPSSTGVIIVQ